MEEPTLEFPPDISGEITKYINNEVKNIETKIIITLNIEDIPDTIDVLINNKITYYDGSVSSYSTKMGFILSHAIPRVIFEKFPPDIEITDTEVIVKDHSEGNTFTRHRYAQGNLINTFKKILDLISFEENIDDAIAKIKEMNNPCIHFNIARY